MKSKKLAAVVTLIMAVLLISIIFSQSSFAATETSLAGFVNTKYTPLNVRAWTNSNSYILTKLEKGSYITLISKSGNWWEVEYAPGRYGYVYGDYIRQVPGTGTASVKLNWGYLNVRWGPGTSYWVKSKLYNGQTVVILSNKNGWSNILYNGKETGYVSSQYLSFNNQSNPNDAATDSPVWPVPTSKKINQYFKSGSHQGIDIAPAVAGVAGNSVLSMLAGKVVYSGWLGDYGYVIYINSYYKGQYIQTRHAHLQKPPFYTAGDTVVKGQTIGALGDTGNSSGVHLHFEVRIRHNSGNCLANSESTPVNPMNYF